MRDQLSDVGYVDLVQERYGLSDALVAAGVSAPAQQGPGRYAGLHRFPKESKEQVVLSYAMLRGANTDLAAEQREAIAKELMKRADYLGVAAQLHGIDRIEATKSAAVVNEPDDSDFAYCRNGERRLYIGTAAHVEKAAAYLEKHRTEFEYQVRRQIARNILAKAAEHEAQRELGLKSRLESTAGDALVTREFATSELSRIAKTAAMLGSCVEVRTALAVASSLAEAGKLDKAAAFVDAAQRVDSRVADGRPIEDLLFFATAEKSAATLDQHVALTTGEVYSRDRLDGLPIAAVEDRLGTELARSLSKDGIFIDGGLASDILPIVPRSDAAALSSVFSELGVDPVIKEAGEAPRLTRSVLKQLAAALD